jgi:hypothetical protein
MVCAVCARRSVREQLGLRVWRRGTVFASRCRSVKAQFPLFLKKDGANRRSFCEEFLATLLIMRHIASLDA